MKYGKINNLSMIDNFCIKLLQGKSLLIILHYISSLSLSCFYCGDHSQPCQVGLSIGKCSMTRVS